ncbi:MAG TPA: NAD(P)H-binding protein [Solirubrobacter sp.]|nr:NAD(P)H-binding protein [Solirubrobacter sp.]
MSLLINGVSGHLGRRVAELVLERTSDVVLLTRTPEAISGLDAEVRFADFDDPSSLDAAFVGGTRMLLVSLPVVGARVPQQKAAIAAAARAGVEHVAYTSILNPTPVNASAVAEEHRETEEALAASGLAWTFLRNSIYADLQPSSAQAALSSGQLVTNAGEGRTSYVTREDCARVAAEVLLGEGHVDQAYDITGPEALNAADLAALYAEVGGRPVEVLQVDDGAYVAGLVEHAGLPPALAAVYTTFGIATREGALSAVTDTVQRLTGRAPGTVREVLAAALR